MSCQPPPPPPPPPLLFLALLLLLPPPRAATEAEAEVPRAEGTAPGEASGVEP